VAGWGTFVLPVALLVIGIWLVLRNIEKLPLLSAERMTGIILLYLNLLSWLHLFSAGGWVTAKSGQGGGYVGAFFEVYLIQGLGQAGAVIVMSAWLLIALGLTLDLSIPDLFRKFQPVIEKIQSDVKSRQTTRAQEKRKGLLQQSRAKALIETKEILDDDFIPLGHTASMQQKTEKPVAAPPIQRSTSFSSSSQHVPSTAETRLQPSVTQGASAGQWHLPDIKTILDPATVISIESNIDKERANLIEETLASFGAPVRVIEIKRGPTITQFGVEPLFVETRSGRTRVRVSKIANLADDLALALAAPRIRIQAPVPGHSYVGIEVPNSESNRVTLLEIIDSKSYTLKKSPLKIALGMNVSGEPISTDLSGLPHILIAGTTGSGKSVCVNSIICCLLLNNSPATLRFIMVDPKRVELTGYNGIPHLLSPVITDTEKVVGALQWIQREMDARYHRFSQVGTRNIAEYNKSQPDKLPYMVVVIDELADLMMLAPDETERGLTRLAQLARATGIHLILATQRPSTDVVTGLIKANFPSRIAFAVASGVDSRVILDQPGAERLLGRGDMLFQAPDAAAPVRLQGVFITEQEIARTVDYWRLQAMNIKPPTQVTTSDQSNSSINLDDPSLKQVPLFEDMAGDDDPLLKQAIEIVRKEGKASITMLQRKLRIGYTRAARMVDELEDKGIISPPLSHSNVRDVLDYGVETDNNIDEEEDLI
jgi:S-DNA-T family DNA segregation ATPase FtsK/SpoIIIE